MRISSGMAEINLTRIQGSSAIREKIFVWPSYNSEGRVNSVYRVSSRSGSNDIYYSKADDELKQQVLDSLKRPSAIYRNNGSIDMRPKFQPGILFDALI
jgi:hypothetical protein